MGKKLSLDREQAMLLVIDVQTRLLPFIRHNERLVEATATLLEAAAVFDIPVVATVQYVKGLGPTHDRLAGLMRQLGIEPLEKACFSACRDAAILSHCRATSRSQVIVAGIEGHVCVLQSVLDLVEDDRQVFVCADAISSRYENDLQAALRRMHSAGASVTTVESVLFELCELSGTPQFRQVLDLVKRFDAVRQ
jgi:isochorismate hydrolase